MAVYFHEIPESRELTFDPQTATHHWVCAGEFDDLAVGNLARSATPTTWLHPLRLLFRQDIQVKEVGHKNWAVTVIYGRDKNTLGSYRFEFDTLGGTVHIKGGVHQAVYPSGRPTHFGLIGVKGDDVEGADIVIPAMRVIVHYTHPGTYITPSIVKTLSRLSGSVDNAGFFEWEPYETLFLGAQGSESGESTTEGTDITTEISYHFAMSENRTNFQIANITGISKKGWDVAWVKWQEEVEGGEASNKAKYVNVVRVYREQSLKAILGFG